MRWNDDSMGSQFLYNQDDLRKDFAAGKIGIAVQAPDIYGQAIPTYGMSPADFGQGQLPQANGTNGTLTGGTIAMFNAKATPDQLLAAAKWVKYQNFQQYYDKSLAISNAEATVASAGTISARYSQLSAAPMPCFWISEPPNCESGSKTPSDPMVPNRVSRMSLPPPTAATL